VIDLHLHTTASDGRLTPAALVRRAAAAGIRILAVTDHDTTDGLAEAEAEAERCGVRLVPGIEVTAVDGGRDVHMLGYFFDRQEPRLVELLVAQRATRIRRIADIAARLAELGMPVDVGSLLDEANRQNSKSIGRPRLARAMIDAGYVSSTREAFDTWLGQGRPAFVERDGPSPLAVIDILHGARGLVSLAHPGRTKIDDQIPSLRDHGLDALEAYHSDHDASASSSYADLAGRLGLLVTGGSDFHGDPSHGVEPGDATLPEPAWEALLDRRRTHGGG
jgi:predicted metal-dependent phosphoesterase TrpH